MAASLPFKNLRISLDRELHLRSAMRCETTPAFRISELSARPGAGSSKSSKTLRSSKKPRTNSFTRKDLGKPLIYVSFLHVHGAGAPDYCSTLEGDASYECWTAYFELKDLEEEVSKDKIESLMRQGGDVRALVGRIHSASARYKNEKKKTEESAKNNNKEGVETGKPSNAEDRQSERHRPFPVPDGLPKTQEEIEEEEKVRMQDSPYTILLRRMGKHAAWFTPRPDHETD
ncbi:hypothetical protein ACLOJK_038683 [Asimina triloba]